MAKLQSFCFVIEAMSLPASIIAHITTKLHQSLISNFNFCADRHTDRHTHARARTRTDVSMALR